MATNRTRRMRGRANITLDESIERFLCSGEAERDTAAWELRVSRFFFDGYDGKIKAAWEERRGAILPEWIKSHPATRPWAFWKVEQRGYRGGESEAAYLDRHGLLTASEKKYLASHPELLEPEKDA